MHGALNGVEEEQRSTVSPQCVHITSLGFDAWCSPQSEPFGDTCQELLHEMLTDGFITSGDVLKVTQPTAAGARLVDDLMSGTVQVRPHRLGNIKSMARACALFMILKRVNIVGIKLQGAHPKLYTSSAR